MRRSSLSLSRKSGTLIVRRFSSSAQGSVSCEALGKQRHEAKESNSTAKDMTSVLANGSLLFAGREAIVADPSSETPCVAPSSPCPGGVVRMEAQPLPNRPDSAPTLANFFLPPYDSRQNQSRSRAIFKTFHTMTSVAGDASRLQHHDRWCLRGASGGFNFSQPRRSMFVQTQPTPNPASLMFIPGAPVLPGSTAEFASARAALTSPLAISLFRIDGVSRVFLGSDFITVTKTDDSSWEVLKPEIFAAIMDFYTSGKPVIDQSATVDTTTGEEDSEVVQQIKELLETRIRPAVQEDGGDIDFHSFDEGTGVVILRMKGACSGCPSSSVTLKSGVENMLMHYIPEVTCVEQLTEDEEASDEASTSTLASS